MVTHREKRSHWWEWELELNLHLLRRIIKRQFNEADLRGILADATDYEKDIEPGRWLILTRFQAVRGKSWSSRMSRLDDLITAYMVE